MSHGAHQSVAPSKRETTLLTALKSGWVWSHVTAPLGMDSTNLQRSCHTGRDAQRALLYSPRTAHFHFSFWLSTGWLIWVVRCPLQWTYPKWKCYPRCLMWELTETISSHYNSWHKADKVSLHIMLRKTDSITKFLYLYLHLSLESHLHLILFRIIVG